MDKGKKKARWEGEIVHWNKMRQKIKMRYVYDNLCGDKQANLTFFRAKMIVGFGFKSN